MVPVPLPRLRRGAQQVAALRAGAFFEGHPAGFFLSRTAGFISYEGHPVPLPPEPARRLLYLSPFRSAGPSRLLHALGSGSRRARHSSPVEALERPRR